MLHFPLYAVFEIGEDIAPTNSDDFYMIFLKTLQVCCGLANPTFCVLFFIFIAKSIQSCIIL